MRQLSRALLVLGSSHLAQAGCPGSFELPGYGLVSVVSATKNTANEEANPVSVAGGGVVAPHQKSRAYFGDRCDATAFGHGDYASFKLLGKTLKYTTDLSSAGCGCSAALLLTSMRHNSVLGDCSDYYCDANSLCGVQCAELDIQTANRFGWHSTLKVSGDLHGVVCGLGGQATIEVCELSTEEYGPNGKCIDTTKPFQVTASFPKDSKSQLAAMEVVLSQTGKSCPLTLRMDRYEHMGVNGLIELSKALSEGMTPVISYWASNDNLWMDGPNTKDPKDRSKGPCRADNASACPASVPFYDFTVENIEDLSTTCFERCPVGVCDRDPDGNCAWFSGVRFAEYESFHCRVDDCSMAPIGEAFSECWTWIDHHYYSIKDYHFPCPAGNFKPGAAKTQILDIVAMLTRWEAPADAAGTQTVVGGRGTLALGLAAFAGLMATLALAARLVFRVRARPYMHVRSLAEQSSEGPPLLFTRAGKV